jgi:hypothetical protein
MARPWRRQRCRRCIQLHEPDSLPKSANLQERLFPLERQNLLERQSMVLLTSLELRSLSLNLRYKRQ